MDWAAYLTHGVNSSAPTIHKDIKPSDNMQQHSIDWLRYLTFGVPGVQALNDKPVQVLSTSSTVLIPIEIDFLNKQPRSITFAPDVIINDGSLEVPEPVSDSIVIPNDPHKPPLPPVPRAPRPGSMARTAKVVMLESFISLNSDTTRMEALLTAKRLIVDKVSFIKDNFQIFFHFYIGGYWYLIKFFLLIRLMGLIQN